MANATKSQATPGPWRVKRDDIWAVEQEETGMVIATTDVCDDGRTDEEAQNNAHLIAAAPQLRDVLSDALDILRAIIDQGALKNVAHLRDQGDVLREDAHEVIEKARAALRAANGENLETVIEDRSWRFRVRRANGEKE